MEIWELFCETGSIDAYLLYSMTENSSGTSADIYDDE